MKAEPESDRGEGVDQGIAPDWAQVFGIEKIEREGPIGGGSGATADADQVTGYGVFYRLRKFGPVPATAELSVGQKTFVDFLVGQKNIPVGVARDIFKAFDKNHNGSVSGDELALTMIRFDTDKDGKVSFEEFKEAVGRGRGSGTPIKMKEAPVDDD